MRPRYLVLGPVLAGAGYGPQKPRTFELMTNAEKSVFSVIATVIKEQVACLGVTVNIRLVDPEHPHLEQHRGVEHHAPYRHQSRRLLRPLATPGKWIRPSARPSPRNFRSA